VLLLVLVEILALVTDDEVVRSEQEPARAAGRVADSVVGAGLDAIDDRLDQLARRKVLTGSLVARQDVRELVALT
jgi:hypothetical protein